MAQTKCVSNLGLAAITALLLTSIQKYVGWGTGTTAAAGTQTALVTPAETNPAGRVTGTQTQQQTTVANDTYQVAATLTAGADLAITEYAIFSTAGTSSPPTGGVMFLRVADDAVNLHSGDSIACTFKVAFAST